MIEIDGEPFRPHPNGRLITPYTLDMEREFQEVRWSLARRYGVENRLNRVVTRTADDWLAELRTDARRRGIGEAALTALDGLRPVEGVLERQRRQPEVTLSWADYEVRVVTEGLPGVGLERLAGVVLETPLLGRQPGDEGGAEAGRPGGSGGVPASDRVGSHSTTVWRPGIPGRRQPSGGKNHRAQGSSADGRSADAGAISWIARPGGLRYER